MYHRCCIAAAACESCGYRDALFYIDYDRASAAFRVFFRHESRGSVGQVAFVCRQEVSVRGKADRDRVSVVLQIRLACLVAVLRIRPALRRAAGGVLPVVGGAVRIMRIPAHHDVVAQKDLLHHHFDLVKTVFEDPQHIQGKIDFCICSELHFFQCHRLLSISLRHCRQQPA